MKILSIEPAKQPHLQDVKLLLENGKQVTIAKYDPQIKRLTALKKIQHKYMKRNSFSIAVAVREIDFDILEVLYEKHSYFVTKEFLFMHGNQYQFNGFEKQVFLPVSKFSRSIEAAKANNEVQTDLFSAA